LFWFFVLAANGGGMTRAALGIRFLSADSEQVGIAKPNVRVSRRLCYTAC